MYTYEEFKRVVTEQIQRKYFQGVSIKVAEVKKNNGVILDGLTICRHDERVAPTIYLNEYYKLYLDGAMQLPEIVQDIIRLNDENQMPDIMDIHKLKQFEMVKDRICMKIVNREKNAELLREIPYVPVLDLAMVFYVILGSNKEGNMTSLIHNVHLEYWNISVDDIRALAIKNSQRLFPAQILSIEEVIMQIISSVSDWEDNEELVSRVFADDKEKIPMYVLSNPKGINGAACMMYPNVLKDFADKMESDLIVLPSSIHEVLVVLDDGVSDYSNLKEMVSHINMAEVSDEEVLSDSVYRYKRLENRLEVLLYMREKDADSVDSNDDFYFLCNK